AYPTPTGTFHVLSKDAHYRSTEFHNAPMPYSVFFYPGDAFHADNVNKWSHGCIHLNWDDAKAFFNAPQGSRSGTNTTLTRLLWVWSRCCDGCYQAHASGRTVRRRTP
ncbi:MAG: L,D-transpeptidase, partial [Pseudonocardiaceae bacterium]